MNKKTIWTIVAIIVVILVVWGITKNTNNVNEQTIKVGILLPLSGPAGFIGENMQKGFETALKNINKNQEQIKLFYEDNNNTPAGALSATKKLIDLNKVDILITSMSSPSIAVASYLKDNKSNLPLIATGVYADIPLIYQNTFQMAITLKSEADAYKRWEEKVKPNKLGILYINTDMGVGLDKLIKSKTALPLNNVYSESFESSARTFKTEITKMMGYGVDTMYVTILTGSDVFVREAKEIGYKGRIIFTSSIYLNGLISLDNEILNGVYTSVPSSYLRLKSLPKGNEEISSEVLYLLEKVVKKGEITDLVNMILNQERFETKTQGILVFDKKSKTIYLPMEIVEIQDGKVIEVK